MVKIKKLVEKNSGKLEEFLPDKIIDSIWFATKKIGGNDRGISITLGEEIVKDLQDRLSVEKQIKTVEIGEIVEKVLIEKGHTKTAQEFIRYRENKKHYIQDKDSLGIEDDLGLSYNTLYILKQRYLKRNEDGEIVETPMGMIKRVAKFVAGAEKTQEKKKFWEDKFIAVMENFDFLPGTRTLANAGKSMPQLANCFVWPMNDDINDIFEILHKSTLIKKNGGGCGYNFSNIRPEGDLVAGIPELAAGPVKMIEMFNLMTSLFRQEGKYESGNMAILNVNHADIFNFISAKQNDGYLSKTNISVGITDDFMKAAINGKDWKLINPRTGKVVNIVKASSILELMAQYAWQTGDPGMINLSAVNKGTAQANPLLKGRGPITATNPCGEEPLYPYESCNLGYVNFVNFVKKDGTFDFQKLSEVMSKSVRFMDNVIDVSWFPVEEVAESVRNHRRIGIGGVGWAEALTMMDIAYDSDEAFTLAEKVAKKMYTSAFDASCEIAKEKGSFPFVKYSIWKNKKKKPRNVALMTFPPSSGNAVIAGTSFGIEPYFALAYEQNVLDGMRLKTVIPLFVRKLKEKGIFSDELIQKVVDNHGSIQSIRGVPKSIKKVFKTAHDISWKDHIKMQAAFQKWTDNAITKTINMPSNATPQDIEEAYMFAWKMGCKGLTVYRDKAKSDQVFDFGGGSDGNNENGRFTKNCPNCEGKLKRVGKCYKCKRCGFETCLV